MASSSLRDAQRSFIMIISGKVEKRISYCADPLVRNPPPTFAFAKSIMIPLPYPD